MVPRGYHPVVVPYGYDSYYLNVMAGPTREWHFRNDPAHEWMLKKSNEGRTHDGRRIVRRRADRQDPRRQRRPPAGRASCKLRGRRRRRRPRSALAAQLGAQVATAEAALADKAVGAVVIGSSTDTHADLITRSAQSGKAIFCEKPVDLAVERARTCADAVKRPAWPA